MKKAENHVKDNKIVFEIIEDGKTRFKTRKKSEIIYMMEAIKKVYYLDNQIATKLCEILPKTYSIVVNRDRNIDRPEEPKIVCETDNGIVPIIIINQNKILWSHINNWCDSEY